MTGVTIDSAENGKIAVEKVMEAPEKWYDLIFMDIQMPITNTESGRAGRCGCTCKTVSGLL